ncbi:MAG: PHP domain-containing protein [Treponema sp.]|jgi:predicted metal-dependent phosphoesterase TrpH|nr:PHP domain-containing protein [Treponema sp.]
MIDLHTHSRASDGNLTPSDLIRTAKERGLTAIALTDHDTIDGLDEAREEAVRQGIELIPGIEFDIDYEPVTVSGEFHLLGLGLAAIGSGFREALAEIRRKREDRNLRLLERIREELGINVEYGEVQAISGGGALGRPHFATLLINRGIVKDQEQAFSRYLGKGRPLYINKEKLGFARALGMIRKAGGIPVLAHPLSLYIAWGRLPDFIADLAAQGLAGIEAWHPTAKVQSCKRLEELGRSLGLYITAGSDFHGNSRPDRKLGFTAGDRPIGENFLDAIPPLAQQRKNAIIQE